MSWKLLPTELHQYSIRDLIRGLASLGEAGASFDPSWPHPLNEAIPVRSARAAIVLAIKALGLRQGSRIGVPLYCCPVVFKSIVTAGCQPRFLDVDPRTYCLSIPDLASKAAELDALVAVHMFGNLCEMAEVARTMTGRPVIEDSAQSIGSRLDGRAAGSMGTIGVFSFRLGKYLSVGEGAALFASDAALRERLSGLVAGLPEPTRIGECVHVFETFLRAKLRSRPLWGLLGTALWGRYNARTEFAEKSPIIMARSFRSDLAIARKRIPLLGQMIDAQRRHAATFLDQLNVDPAMVCRERPGAFYSRLMFPVLFETVSARQSMRARLLERDISTATPYEEAIEGAALHYGYRGDCPVSERLLKQTMLIPCHHRLRPKDIRNVVESFNQAWGETARA